MRVAYPNLFVVGAPKSGTTSIYDYLAEHPSVFVPVRKELHFHSSPELRANVAGPGDAAAVRGIVTSSEEYQGYFAHTDASHTVVADVSPSYLYHARSAGRIHAVSPNARIVVLVRDPVERAYSQYLHLVRVQRENLDFEAALDAEDARRSAGWASMWRYVDTSRYARQISTYLETFGSDRVLILHAEHLRAARDETMAKLFDFIGLEPVETSGLDERNAGGAARSKLVARTMAGQGIVKAAARAVVPKRYRRGVALRALALNTGAKPQLETGARARLQEAFADEAVELAALTGAALPWSWVRG